MRLMTDKRIRHLPVVEGSTIAGIVSIGDLVRSVITLQGETIQYLQQYINGQYQRLGFRVPDASSGFGFRVRVPGSGFRFRFWIRFWFRFQFW